MGDADKQKWDARYAARGPHTAGPDEFLLSVDHALPHSGLALDVAGGTGRHALWLANRGLETTLLDISETGLAIADQLASAARLELNTCCVNLERESLPSGPWDLVLVFNYLYRPLFADLVASLSPGGVLVYCQPTMKNLERHAHPSARFLLAEGELPTLIGDLHVVQYDESWSESGRHEARLVARK